MGATASASLAAAPLRAQSTKPSLPFADLRETPAQITVFAGLDNARPTRSGNEWRSGNLVVTLDNAQTPTVVSLAV